MTSLRTLQKTIHVGAKALGLDDDGRRELQLAVTGKASMADMGEEDLRLIVERMRQSGFNPGKGHRKPAAPRADLRLCHVLWRRLSEAGAVERKGREGLNAFVRARFGQAWGAEPADIDMIRDHDKVEAVIRALKAIGRRHGVDLERRERP